VLSYGWPKFIKDDLGQTPSSSLVFGKPITTGKIIWELLVDDGCGSTRHLNRISHSWWCLQPF